MRAPLVALLAAVLPASLLVAAPAAAAVDYDCSDFTYWEDAQAVYDRYAPSDPYRLDADGDGIACEALPKRGTEPAPAPAPAPAPSPPPPPPATSYSHDFSGDARPDVVAAAADGALLLYRGTGRGGFGTMSKIGSGWSGRDMINHAGDWDRNGTRDLIARNPSDGNLWLYRGNGRGGFSSSAVIGRGWTGFAAIVAPGDWTGDRNPDLLTAGRDGSMRLYPGNGRGGFATSRQIGSGWGGMDGLTSVGDWDGDGRNDLLARSRSTGQLWLYPGNGTGGFRTSRAIGTGWSGFTALVGPGDWNGSGSRDVLARRSTGELYLYNGNGRGGFTGSTRVGTGWSTLRLAGSTVVAAPAPTPPPAPLAGTARSLFESLAVTPETTTAYDRAALFGDWVDADRDGCDTRAEVLERQSSVSVTYSSGCTVATGSWQSYYDGATWTLASDVDIDHMVPLKEAWDSGASAQAWAADRRSAYANDLGYLYSLEAVTDNVNQSKSDQDVAEWLPPVTSAHCTYAVRWVAVKYRWRLAIDPAEHTALSSLLAGSCGDSPISEPAQP